MPLSQAEGQSPRLLATVDSKTGKFTATDPRVRLLGAAHIVITKLKKEDEGIIRCLAHGVVEGRESVEVWNALRLYVSGEIAPFFAVLLLAVCVSPAGIFL